MIRKEVDNMRATRITVIKHFYQTQMFTRNRVVHPLVYPF